MFKRRLFPLVLGILLCFCSFLGHAQSFVEIPPLNRHVTDLIGLITKEQANEIEEILASYRKEKGCEIAILLIDKTEPEHIDQYSMRVVEEWQLGRKGIDDGVLLIVAPQNPKSLRRFRIEVGRGAEDVLTDSRSNRILQEVIAPYFRRDDFYGGLKAGAISIINTLNKKEFAPPNQAQDDTSDLFSGFITLLFLILFVFFIYRRTRRNLAHGIVLGGSSDYYNDLPRYSSSRSSGSYDSSSYSSSGSFSGGGGSFSGGGASGNW